MIVTPEQIPPIVKQAVVSIEDKRFQTNSGVDIRGIARAFVQDVVHKGTMQGASTIEQQFIKNALQAQSHRTILEKLREAALAYQLSHKWSKEKIITAYLNTIYFGNGAYGIESAAQTYFGSDVNHLGCGTPGAPAVRTGNGARRSGLARAGSSSPPPPMTRPTIRSRPGNGATWCWRRCCSRATSGDRSPTKASVKPCPRRRTSRHLISPWWKGSTWVTSPAGCSSR